MAWIWRVKDRAKIIAIALVFNIIMNIILINLIWVYWAALATWFGWMIIWIMSEIVLWKEYRLKLNVKNIIKNLIVFSISWFLFYEFIIWDYLKFSRIESFFMLALMFWIWCIVFLVTNFKDLKLAYSQFWKIKKA